MRELQLTRSPDDKRRLDLPGVGSVRFENMWGTKLCFSSAGGAEWRIAGRRRGPVEVRDALGTTVATIDGRRATQGDRHVDVITPHQGLLERRPPFVLLEGDRELARVASRVWDEKPIDVTVLDEDFVSREPMLFLVALYAANRIASSRQAAAAASATGIGTP
jgi:hypothetical protein